MSASYLFSLSPPWAWNSGNFSPPILDPPYQRTFEFEKFDVAAWSAWMGQNRFLGIYIGIFYVALVFTLKHWMRTRKPLELRRLLVAWNVGHALFSAAAISRCYYPFYHVLTGENGGWYQSVCSREGRTMTEEFWMLCAAWSRVAEMGDTIFFVLRKSPLIFLHWYHHLVVVIFCFYAYDWMDPVRRWLLCLNLTIHAVMYSYYALRMAGYKVPKGFAISLTTVQILQMVIGTSLGIYSLYAMSKG